MRTMAGMLAMCALLAAALAQAADSGSEPEAAKRPHIQIALLLDTSGSMSGLINQARTQLWKVVNEFATAKRDGKTPDLEVALYEYGNSRLSSKGGWIRQLCPLTTDLDKVSEELFALTTRGGREYCGQVIQVATNALAWSADNHDYKAIFIAGNEPFTQGPVNYQEACRAAIAKGVIVNTIHCGSHNAGISGKWKHGADLADGTYSHIDQDRKVAHVPAPQDKRIAELATALNTTYVTYGQAGRAGLARQSAQDANARRLSAGAFLGRNLAKASVHYRNAAWDLVDALREGKVKLEDLKEEDLPEKVQKMTPAERKAYVEAQAAKRAEIQKEIRELSEARRRYVAAEMRRQAAAGGPTLDSAIIRAVRTQAQRRNFQLK